MRASTAIPYLFLWRCSINCAREFASMFEKTNQRSTQPCKPAILKHDADLLTEAHPLLPGMRAWILCPWAGEVRR